MVIVYIHGFNSGPSTASGKNLRKCFPDADLRVMDYDSAHSFYQIYAKLRRELGELPTGEKKLLAGSSLGGYYAALLGNDLKLPTVIANPCNDPRKSLEQFLGQNVSFEDNHPWTFTREALESYAPLRPDTFAMTPALVIIGRNDCLLNPAENEKFWRDYSKIILTGDEHSIASFEPLREAIMEAAGLSRAS